MVNDVDWKKLVCPTPLFKIMEINKEKFNAIFKMLMEKELYLEDRYRDNGVVGAIILNFYNSKTLSIMYEVGNFDGLLGMEQIIPGHKAHLTFKIWNPKIFGPSFVKESIKFLDIQFDVLKLKRISTSSPDERMVKLARMAGFKLEGKLRKSFSWNGELYDEYLLSKIKE